MLADFFTKPLQGALFRKFRDVVMGREHVDTLNRPVLAPSQERVGNHALTENKRPGSNSLKSQEHRGEPSDTGTHVSYASVVQHLNTSGELYQGYPNF